MKSNDEHLNEIKRRASILNLDKNLSDARNYYEKINAMREYYHLLENEIIEFNKARPLQFYKPYPADWHKIFTPVERMAWDSIKIIGHVVLYPQYPVLNYVVDFGNPLLKIGLEVDGKGFHDRKRDAHRDMELKNIGWTIYRVTGGEMANLNFKNYFDCIEEDLGEEETKNEITHWIQDTGDGVIQAIKAVHFRNSDYDTHDWFYNLCIQSLNNRKLV